MSTPEERRGEMRSLPAICFRLFSEGGGGEAAGGGEKAQILSSGQLGSGVTQVQHRPHGAWRRAPRSRHSAGFPGFLGSSARGHGVKDKGSLGWATLG